jgi:hypothetical protein
MRDAMNKAHTAHAESVRRTDSGRLIPDWPRLIATLEGIDVGACPEDFRVAWDEVVSGYRVAYSVASQRNDSGSSFLKKALGVWGAWALASSGNYPGAVAALAGVASEGEVKRPDSDLQHRIADSDLQHRIARLSVVCERHGLKRVDATASAR